MKKKLITRIKPKKTFFYHSLARIMGEELIRTETKTNY